MGSEMCIRDRENLSNQLAPIELLKAVNRTDEFIGLQNEYVQD